MKVYSAILVIKEHARCGGTVEIPFEAFQGEGSDVGDATIHQTRQVGGDGIFVSDPAYTVNIRECKTEDRTRGAGGSEIDWMELNSVCNRHRLRFTWCAHDCGAQVLEISFLVIGE